MTTRNAEAISPGADWPVVPIKRLDLLFAPRAWPFAQMCQADIAQHFAVQQRANPALWNGRVLVMHAFDIEGDILRGAYLEADFASFLAWRDWGCPDPDVRNCFGMAALRGSDGGFLLGVMGRQTANAGKIYFPAGTPDPSDVVDGTVDITGSVNRELREETGLDAREMNAEPGWHAVLAGPRIALMKVLRAREDAATLRQRILRHLASERTPELSDVVLVRSPSDLSEAVPDHVTAFLHHVWRLDRP